MGGQYYVRKILPMVLNVLIEDNSKVKVLIVLLLSLLVGNG